MGEDKKFRFQIPPFAIAGLPLVKEREFGRVVVILGINGSGKSRMLMELAKLPKIDGEKREVVYVEGGRAISLQHHPKLHSSQTLRGQVKLLHRMPALVAELQASEERQVGSHKDALYQWDKATKQGVDSARPREEPGAFSKTTERFSRLIRGITFERRSGPPNGLQWLCFKAGQEYDISALSDGEKQIFALLADIAVLGPEKALIVVDEPELNLHSRLADDFWTSLENQNESSVFVYATHSLSFAMRPNITDVIILGSPEQDPVHLSKPFSWPTDQLGPFLGAIPGILTTKHVVVTEGNGEQSFDRNFYRWILGTSVTIQNVGSRTRVRDAVAHIGVWSKITDITVKGVVDRDFDGEEELEKLRNAGCYVLGFHEAESYLCHPKLLTKASTHSGKNVSEDEITKELAGACDRVLIRTVISRTIRNSTCRLAIGEERDSWPKTENESREAVRQWAKDQLDFAKNFDSHAISQFDMELNKCRDAIEKRDIDAMLALFPAKEGLLPGLSRFIGFNNPENLLSSVVRNMDPAEFPWLIEIRKALAEVR